MVDPFRQETLLDSFGRVSSDPMQSRRRWRTIMFIFVPIGICFILALLALFIAVSKTRLPECACRNLLPHNVHTT